MNTLIWHNMFALGLPLAEKILRPILVYAFLIIGLRLAGKRELAQLNPFDLVVLLTLSNTVQNAIIGDDNTVTGGVIGASTLLFVNYVLVRFVSRHEKVERFIEGEPRMLIENGEIKTDCLDKEAISLLELEAAAHKQGFASLAEVDRAELDPNGSLAFFGKTPTPDTTRHEEIMKRLDQMTAQLAALKA
ncbi:MAG TPA: YetF domain-containing protein [Vicinamibacterales bacterium]|nr:YetF domain-containing protein [Vicinamibacterales bacterium]